MKAPQPPRVHVFLAPGVRKGLVIRQGARKLVCSLEWDLESDAFTVGEWARGCVAVELCDLAPDGRHFLYAARTFVDEVKPWTAVSRVPYLKPLAYYPARNGGGWFVEETKYCAPGSRAATDRESPELERVSAQAPERGVETTRLLRLGWEIDREHRGAVWGMTPLVRPAGGGWTLRQLRGRYQLTRGNRRWATQEWCWAEMEGTRLCWTQRGCLWAAQVREEGLEEVKLLRDFNGMVRENLKAPYGIGATAAPMAPPRSAVAPPARKARKARAGE